jgi:hypothetical protein
VKKLSIYSPEAWTLKGKIILEWQESSLWRRIQIVILSPMLAFFWLAVISGFVIVAYRLARFVFG